MRPRKRKLPLTGSHHRSTGTLAQNSTNSHKPPASDSLDKKPLIKPALPKDTTRKQGGQPGYPGKTLLMVEQPDVVFHHAASNCEQCGLPLTGAGQILTRRQVFDLTQPRLEVAEHQLIAHRCSRHQIGTSPDHLKALVQYGPRLSTLSMLWNVDCRLPIAKVGQLWADPKGHAYNGATLFNSQQTLSEQIVPLEALSVSNL